MPQSPPSRTASISCSSRARIRAPRSGAADRKPAAGSSSSAARPARRAAAAAPGDRGCATPMLRASACAQAVTRAHWSACGRIRQPTVITLHSGLRARICGRSGRSRGSHLQFRILRACLAGPYLPAARHTRDAAPPAARATRTIGVRIPDHPVPRLLLAELGEPLNELDPAAGFRSAAPDEGAKSWRDFEHEIDRFSMAGTAASSRRRWSICR